MAKSKSDDTSIDGVGNVTNNDPFSEFDSQSGGDSLSNGGDAGDIDVEPVTTASSDSGTGDPTAGIETVGRKVASSNGRKSTDNDSGRSAINRRQKAPQKLDLKSAGQKALATQIVGAHEVVGILTGLPEICAITQEQGDAMVEAVTNVLAQYKIKPNPKVAAWLSLAGVMGIVYVPKVIAVRQIIAIRKVQNPPPQRQAPTIVKAIDPTSMPQPPMQFS